MKNQSKWLYTAVACAVLSCHGLAAQEASKEKPAAPLPPIDKASVKRGTQA